MKKIIVVLSLCMVFIMGNNVNASSEKIEVYSTRQKVALNGEKANIYGYSIDGYNYYKLRDLAAALKNTNSKFGIDFTGNIVNLRLNEDYLISKEDQKEVSRIDYAALTEDEVLIEESKLEAKAYKISGYNYYKLRDLGMALGIKVDYNKESDTILIYTNIKNKEIKSETI